MKYRIIDTHCHPQFPQYDSDRDEVIGRALHKGIGMVCVGTGLDTSRAAIELASKYESLYASVGLHPNDELGAPFDEREFEKLAAHPRVVAIGEVGLDYYRTPNPEHRRIQQERFISQLAMARRLSLPVIIHCRDSAEHDEHGASAHGDMIGILRREAKGIRAVLHSFNGSVEQARTYLNEGFYIGLNAIITFSALYDEMIRMVPIDRILLETDAPYLAPAPYRGKRNEPIYIEGVGNYIAGLRNMSADALFDMTSENAHNLFDLLK